MNTEQCLLEQAIRCHQNGQRNDAEKLYHSVLENQPRHPEALHLTALFHVEEGAYSKAETLLRRASTVCPESVGIQICLGDVLCLQKRPSEAVEVYRHVLKIKPTSTEAWLCLGDALIECDTFTHAKDAFKKALDLQPRSATLWMRLGQVHSALDELKDAERCFYRVLEVDEGLSEAWLNLGSIYIRKTTYDKAEAAFRKAGKQHPSAEAFAGLGDSLREQRRLTEAVQAYTSALECAPQDANTHNSLGVTFRELKQLQKALTSFQRAIEENPSHPESWNNLIQVRQELCDWQDYDTLISQIEQLSTRSLAEETKCPITPFTSLSLPLPPSLQRRIAHDYARRHGWDHLSERLTRYAESAPLPLRLHIGYVSSDFHNHPVAHLVCGLFAAHDREAVEVSVYSFGGEDDSPYRKRVVEGADHFIDITNCTDREAAQRIAEDRVHILVDLKGYTLNHRPGIFTHRPAPLQVNWLGYPGTLGTTIYDYIIGDPTVTPKEHQAFYAERIAQMPHCYQVNDAQQEIASQVPSRIQAGLPSQAFVYCCFNQNYKFEPRLFRIWMEILRAVPRGVLWMLRYSPDCVEHLRQEAKGCGIDPNRLIFGDRMSKSAHLARHQLADLFLDTCTYNAHTTASDALYAGVPLLTCPQESFASRVAASLLRCLGVPELIASDLDSYKNLAIRLGQHPEEVELMRSKIESLRKTSPLFDTQRFATDLEDLYRRMWYRQT